MTEANDNTGQRDRSPSYPIVPLEVALARLVEFDAHFKRSVARREKVGEAWGIKAKAYADRTLAALGYFGLLGFKGAGEGRYIVVSEEGRKYLRAQQEQTKQEVVKAAALRPKQIAKFWAAWGAVRPADAACIDEMTMKNGFSDVGAHDFLKVYDATISFAKLSDSDKIEAEINGGSDAVNERHEPVMQASPKPSHLAASPLQTSPPVIGKPHIVMNGDHLDIHAAVDLAGLKQLQTMLKKYEEILEMMNPQKDEAAN